MPSSNNTATFAFAPWASYSPKVLSITPPGYTLEMLDDSDLSTTGFKQLLPGDLQEIGEMNIVVRLPSDSFKRFTNEVGDLMVAGVGFDKTVGSATITWPLGTTGDAQEPTLVGTAAVTGFEPGELNNDEQGTATITLQFDGKTGPTYAVGTAV